MGATGTCLRANFGTLSSLSGYIDSIVLVANFQVGVNPGDIDVADDGHVRNAIGRFGPCKQEKPYQCSEQGHSPILQIAIY